MDYPKTYNIENLKVWRIVTNLPPLCGLTSVTEGHLTSAALRPNSRDQRSPNFRHSAAYLPWLKVT